MLIGGWSDVALCSDLAALAYNRFERCALLRCGIVFYAINAPTLNFGTCRSHSLTLAAAQWSGRPRRRSGQYRPGSRQPGAVRAPPVADARSACEALNLTPRSCARFLPSPVLARISSRSGPLASTARLVENQPQERAALRLGGYVSGIMRCRC
jgi:hypothetical protein